MIPYGKQNINQTDIDAVVSVLKSDFLTQGPAVPTFEKSMTGYTGAKHAIAVSNATAALHIACLALGLKPGGKIYTSPVTFVASANCALYIGARVDFIDIDPVTYNMDPLKLEQKLVEDENNGTLPDIVIPVHLAGQSCDMEKIHKLSQRFGFKIIEDASHAVGGKYQGSPVGNCRFSDVTIFSFHPVKIITTGEGGMLLTNSDTLATKLEELRSHGITRDPAKLKKNDGPWYYEQQDLGFNYRITDIQAALGKSQLQRLDEFVEKRNQLANRYNEKLKGLPLVTPVVNSGNYSAFHLYIIRLELEKISKTHKQVFEELRAAGIGVNLHYIPIYRQPYYHQFGYEKNDFTESEKYYSEAISLPLYYDLTEELQDEIIRKIKQIF